VRLRRVADLVGALRDQVLQQHTLVEARAADQEAVGRPLTALVAAPGLPQPADVGLEAAAGHHAGAGLDAFAADQPRCDETAAGQFQLLHRAVVAHAHPQRLCAAVVGVDQRLASAHEERVGTAQVQRARQRRLEAHPVPAHPVAAARRLADHLPRQRLVGLAGGDLQQVLPELFLRVGLGQHVLRRVVHAAQVARVHRIAAPPRHRRRFEQQHAGTAFACGQGRTERGVAAADHENIDHGVDCRRQPKAPAWRSAPGRFTRQPPPG
jgi:hypothetical protein